VDTRKINDLNVTIVGIGCNNFGRRLDRAGTDAVVHAAMENGINFFDTADVYGDGSSEEYLGKALGSRRDEVGPAGRDNRTIGRHRVGLKGINVGLKYG
jgi:aryl-alcohol dehydrogenase-like predicted oxidoreductase